MLPGPTVFGGGSVPPTRIAPPSVRSGGPYPLPGPFAIGEPLPVQTPIVVAPNCGPVILGSVPVGSPPWVTGSELPPPYDLMRFIIRPSRVGGETGSGSLKIGGEYVYVDG